MLRVLRPPPRSLRVLLAPAQQAPRAYSSTLYPSRFSPHRRQLLESRPPFRISSRRCYSSSIDTADSIYALSTAPGKAGIAVIRISGADTLDAYKALCPSSPNLKPRYAAVRTLYDPEHVEEDGTPVVLDHEAVVLYFPAPRSVTGENVLELHIHGGPATVRAVLGALSRISSKLRYAEPGEFTRRAFYHDRLNLAQVEALAATLDAETEQQRRVAVRTSQLQGKDGRGGGAATTYRQWRDQLVEARAELEALIDFSEDHDFEEGPAVLLGQTSKLVRRLLQGIAAHEAAADRNSLLRDGIRLALLGPANAGKSSLMNLVVGREASIVSQEAGTTRDIVEARLDLRGYLCTFADTAGFRKQATDVSEAGAGSIEAEGIRRAREKAADSDVVVVLASVEKIEKIEKKEQRSASAIDKSDSQAARNSKDIAVGPYYVRYDIETLRLAAQARQRLVVLNKCDVVGADRATLDELIRLFRLQLADVASTADAAHNSSPPPLLLTVSCKRAEDALGGGSACVTPKMQGPSKDATALDDSDPGGIRLFADKLVDTFKSMTSLPSDSPQYLLGITARQKQLLVQCRDHLLDFLEDTQRVEPDVVIAAEHLRDASNCLARVIGHYGAGDIEEVLGVIFEKFCVGK